MANVLYFENVINSSLMTGNRPTEQRCLLGIIAFGVRAHIMTHCRPWPPAPFLFSLGRGALGLPTRPILFMGSN